MICGIVVLLSAGTIDVGTVIDALDVDELCHFVDGIDDTVGSAAGTVLSREIIAQRLPDPVRGLKQLPTHQLNDRRRVRYGNPGKRSAGGR